MNHLMKIIIITAAAALVKRFSYNICIGFELDKCTALPVNGTTNLEGLEACKEEGLRLAGNLTIQNLGR